MNQDLFAKLAANPDLIDKELNPGRYLYDIDPKELPIEVMPSGFPTLDESLFLKRGEGELIIIAARPSVGKSALAFGIGLNVSLKEEVHVFSLEMSHASIGRRILSNSLSCSISDIQHGRVNDLLSDGINNLKPYRFFLDERSSLSADEICDAARNHHRRKKTGLIIIDYCQIMGVEKGHSRALEIAEGTAKLKALGKELRCPIILLSQLNRQSENRGASTGNYTPVLSDLKESGAIEEAADIVIGIDREVLHTKLRPKEADIVILKNRNGPIGKFMLNFDSATSSFKDPKNKDEEI